jgi:AAA+ ATPase superfamily predicted ATPase
MNNPFKFGSVVDDPFFTNRIDELAKLQAIISSNNHLIMISPRRFGKTSLIRKVVKNNKRNLLFLDLQLINSIEDFAAQYLRRIYRIFPSERIKEFIRNFRIIPTLTLNPVNNEMEVSFQSRQADLPLLEDALNLLDQLSDPDQRTIVVFDEFQDLIRLGNGIDRKLRSIMQLHKNINYILLGSQESMMREIFEKKKSPFYHFGLLFPLQKINKKPFTSFISDGMNSVCNKPDFIAEEIFNFTDGHPYYTQQLAYTTWNILKQDNETLRPVEQAILETVQIHDFDYERLWATVNNTDKKTLTNLAQRNNNRNVSLLSKNANIGPSSTIFSSLKRLMLNGNVIKTEKGYEIDDPFFKQWIIDHRDL